MTETVNIEIDGKKVQAEQGAMIIEAADSCGAYIPRFCYHKKLSVAANCRMCLIEVEGGRKAMPACATPITDGMKIKTRSELAIKSQKAVMEFLLINHPLDCPICDQGGECELQDLAMGYGSDHSRYDSTKRVVLDKDLGPLVATDMTRCILCTRCVRFTQEIAGLQELGTMGRGEHVEIGTYIEGAVSSEISGNIIDVCPVGALTSKPFRYTARAWELQQRPSIAAHDCLGSNIFVHSVNNEVKRVVPKDNEAINESWISDRDRFSYVGVNSEERVLKPMLKKDGVWQAVDWNVALEIVASSFENIKQHFGAEQIAGLISPNATVEEHYLFQKVLRGFGASSIDHRLHQVDFADQQALALAPELGLPIAALEKQETVLLIGADIHQEIPLLSVRLIKAVKRGAAIIAMNTYDAKSRFAVRQKITANTDRLAHHLAAILKVLDANALTSLTKDVQVTEQDKMIAELFKDKRASIILGATALNSAHAATLRILAKAIAQVTGASFGELTEGANAAGAWIAGAVPHRGVGGSAVEKIGHDAQTMFSKSHKAYMLFNVEPEFDCAESAKALSALRTADFVVACSPFMTDAMRDYADVILPIVPSVENEGTFINCNHVWQSFSAGVLPKGEARPGWKILRVLGTFLEMPAMEYKVVSEVLSEMKTVVESAQLELNTFMPMVLPNRQETVPQWALYRLDNVVRRSTPLQKMAEKMV